MSSEKPEAAPPNFGGFASPNGTYVPNEFLDKVLGEIEDNGELRVTLCIIRFTLGYRRRIVQLSQSLIMGWTGLSRNTVRRGLEMAIQRGTILEAAPASPRGATTYAMRFADDLPDADDARWREILERTRARAKGRKEKDAPLEGYPEMFAAVSEVCNVDPAIKSNAGRIGKTAKELLTAGYTPEEVKQHYSHEGWWYKNWRGAKGEAPTYNGILTTIAEARGAGVSSLYEEVR